MKSLGRDTTNTIQDQQVYITLMKSIPAPVRATGMTTATMVSSQLSNIILLK